MTNNVTPALLKYAEIIRKLITHGPGAARIARCVRVHHKNAAINSNSILIILPYCTRDLEYTGDTVAWYELVCTRLLPHNFSALGLYPYTTRDAWSYDHGGVSTK